MMTLTNQVLSHLPTRRARAGGLFARRILLEAGAHAGAVRYITALATLPDGSSRETWVTVTRAGRFWDHRYGDFEITPVMLAEMVKNFSANTYRQDIFIDISHQPEGGAAGVVKRLEVQAGKLRALVQWTDYGLQQIQAKAYRYLSAEFVEHFQDNETKVQHGTVLLGAGLTIRPVIKGLDPVQLAEGTGDRPPTFIDPSLQVQLSSETKTMWKQLLEALKAKLQGLKLGDAACKTLCDAAEAAVGGVTDQAIAQKLVDAFEASGKQLADLAGGTAIKLDLTGVPAVAPGLTAEQVAQVFRDEAKKLADASAASAKKLADNRKLLADTIGAAKDVDDDTKKKLAEDVNDLVTGDLTEDQVKRLAANQLKHAGELAAARQLAAMGFHPTGRVHIDMGMPGEINQLQEAIDKRLKLAGIPDRDRFKRTEKLQPENKLLAEAVLAAFDQENAPKLLAEQKALAAGTGSVSDTALPAIFERTVIREALYDLIAPQFMDVGTAPFAEIIQIPYAYRDQTAAGMNSLRVYEGQGIPRSGMKQTYDSVRPLPQKLAFLLSDEMRMLTNNGSIDWDGLAENVLNAGRIVGEDTERTCFNEVVDASDSYAFATATTEAVGSGNGTKTIFPVAQFPVLRPTSIYNLKGVLQGSVQHPITVTVNAVAKTMYDGTGTQSAGLYWTMNYNLGELTFVSELGVPTAVTNTHAIVATYDYSTNAAKFDTDLGSDLTDAHWDKFLYALALRKGTIEDTRYFNVDMGLMSGTLRSAIEQAKQFGANAKREGTSLQADGNLGRIKDVPMFKTTAPGLLIGDTRVAIGKRGTSRLRICKPWAMEQLENARNSNGNFTGQKEAYGTQWIAVNTPTQLKAAYSSIITYSSSGRVSR